MATRLSAPSAAVAIAANAAIQQHGQSETGAKAQVLAFGLMAVGIVAMCLIQAAWESWQARRRGN